MMPQPPRTTTSQQQACSLPHASTRLPLSPPLAASPLLADALYCLTCTTPETSLQSTPQNRASRRRCSRVQTAASRRRAAVPCAWRQTRNVCVAASFVDLEKIYNWKKCRHRIASPLSFSLSFASVSDRRGETTSVYICAAEQRLRRRIYCLCAAVVSGGCVLPLACWLGC